MRGDSEQVSAILGLCNPLLDISAYVDEEILRKYKLKPNDVILASEEHKDLCKELVEKYPVEYTAGGSAQNVMRVAAGLLRSQKFSCNVFFTGCISDDEFGEMMKKKAQEDGVITNYSISKTEPTGTCAVCLTDQGKNRSLCAFLGASQKFTDQHLQDNWDQLVAKTDIVYISGFLIAVSPASYHLLGKHVAESKGGEKRFCLNLSAPYVSSVFGTEIRNVMGYVDILFGNDDEAKAYAEFNQWTYNDFDELAKKLCKIEKVRSEIGRLVILTRGADPIIVARDLGAGKIDVRHFPVKQIPDCDMVDTNGAGDSFAGGFLSQFIQGCPIERCIEVGSYAAREIIKMSGVVMPKFDNIPQ